MYLYTWTYIHRTICTVSCMSAIINTYIHEWTHTYMHAYMPTYIQACLYPCRHTEIHTYMHACIQNAIPGNMSSNKEYISDHRCKRTNMAVKWKYLWHLIGIFIVYRFTCVDDLKSHWHKLGKSNMSIKQGIHKWSLMWRKKYGFPM